MRGREVILLCLKLAVLEQKIINFILESNYRKLKP